MILPTIAEMARVVESGDAVTVAVLDIEPLTWEPATLYGWPAAQELVPYETGPACRHDFDVRLVFVAQNENEEALRERSVDLAAALADKMQTYMDALRHLPHHEPYWTDIRVAQAIAPRTLDARGVAVRVTGYRLLPG